MLLISHRSLPWCFRQKCFIMVVRYYELPLDTFTSLSLSSAARQMFLRIQRKAMEFHFMHDGILYRWWWWISFTSHFFINTDVSAFSNFSFDIRHITLWLDSAWCSTSLHCHTMIPPHLPLFLATMRQASRAGAANIFIQRLSMASSRCRAARIFKKYYWFISGDWGILICGGCWAARHAATCSLIHAGFDI